MNARRVGKQVRDTAPLRIESGVISDQADMLVAQRRKFLRLQNVEAGLHAAGASGLFRASVRRPASGRGQDRTQNRAESARLPFRPASEAKVLHSADTNDIVERCFWSCVVRVMCVCYIQTLHPARTGETHN